MRLRFLAAVLAIPLTAAPATAFERVGVVLLHGKTGSPNQFGAVADFLIESGFAVEAPEMCWSDARLYDAPLAECFADVDGAIDRLHADGITRIVVGGHSLGALGALAYAATHPGVAGVIALGPAGDPADFNRNPAVAKSVKAAEAMVAAGDGDVPEDFTDRVMGKNFTVHTTPNAFLSFLGPDSPLAIRSTLRALDAPLLWVAGTRDANQGDAAALFKLAPPDPQSRLVKVNATHLGTPDAATTVMAEWLDALEDR